MQRRGKFGRPFYGCDRYPKCDYIVNDLAQAGADVPESGTPTMAAPSRTAKRPAAQTAKAQAGRPSNGKAAPRTPATKTTRPGTKKVKT